MDKRYQVFVSSTYQDLQEERQEVMQALLELDCIPSGMELFPAANEDQWSLIKRVIDDCDYYIVIIGGRYGSIGMQGISYTEMEYRYALEKGKPIIAFLHKNPGELPANRTEETMEGRDKLEVFRKFVQNKMIKHWTTPSDLGSVVSRSIVRLIKDYPAVGWVRADQVPDISTTQEILNLRNKIDELNEKLELAKTQAPEGTEQLARGDDVILVNYNVKGREERANYYETVNYSLSFETTWNEMFYAISPIMIFEAKEKQVLECLNNFIIEKQIEKIRNMKELKKTKITSIDVKETDYQTIVIQFRALGLITKSNRSKSVKDTSTYWSLTPYGDEIMTQLRAIKR